MIETVMTVEAIKEEFRNFTFENAIDPDGNDCWTLTYRNIRTWVQYKDYAKTMDSQVVRGYTISIAKWILLVRAARKRAEEKNLRKLSDGGRYSCGLCIAYADWCVGCPIAFDFAPSCHNMPYNNASDALHDASLGIRPVMDQFVFLVNHAIRRGYLNQADQQAVLDLLNEE